MATYYSLRDGLITDTSAYGMSIPSVEKTTNTTAYTLTTSDSWSVALNSQTTDVIDSIAVHLSSRSANPVGVLSAETSQYAGILTKTGTTLSAVSPFPTIEANSLYFNGTTSSYVRASTPVSLPGDFTIETWAYFNALPTGTNFRILIESWSENTGWQLNYRGASSALSFYINSSVVMIDPSTTRIATNTWYHIAVTRSSNTLRMFVNGTQCVSATNSANIVSTNPLNIGTQSSNNTHPYNGYMSNIRIVNGTALYTSSFTPSGPLSIVSNTSFLYQSPYINAYKNSTAYLNTLVGTYPISSFTSYDGSNNTVATYPLNWQLLKLSAPFTNSSGYFSLNLKTSDANQLSLMGASTVNGVDYDKMAVLETANIVDLSGSLTKTGTTLSAGSPFDAGVDGSIVFSNGNFLTLTNPAQFYGGIRDFTFETWIYTSDNSFTIFSVGGGTNRLSVGFNVDNSTQGLGVWRTGVGTIGSTGVADTRVTAVTSSTWKHIAVVRKNSVFYYFIDGELISTVNSSYSFTSSTISYVGRDGNTSGFYYTGFISNLRFIDGEALYTSSFNPIRSPLNTYYNFEIGSYTSILYKSPYSTTYLYSDTTYNLHIGGIIDGFSTQSRTITAETMVTSDIYVHKNGLLKFSDTSTELTINGSNGLQVTCEGTLQIGTSSNPIPTNTTHKVILNNSDLGIHNGAKLDVYGAYKLPYTYQSFDTPISTNTFSTTNNVSSTWLVNDVLLFAPVPFSRVSDTLILSSFINSNQFTTTTNSLYQHNSISSVPVPTILNATRNIKIQGLNTSSRGNIIVLDAAKANINNAELNNLGYDLAGYRNIVFNTNSEGYVNLINCTINSGAVANIGGVGLIGSSLRPYAHNVILDNNIIYNFGSTIRGLIVSDVLTNNLKVTNNYISGGGGTSGASLLFSNMTAYDMQMNNNYVVNSNTNGTYINRSTISGVFGGVTNYNSLSQGLALSLSGNSLSSINLSSINCLYSTKEGIYIDAASVGNTIGQLTFNNINILSSITTGFVLANNTQNYVRPFNLNINNLSATKNTKPFILSNISGTLSNLYIVDNFNTSNNEITVGNGRTLISNISLLSNFTQGDLSYTGSPVNDALSPFGAGIDGSINLNGGEINTTQANSDFWLDEIYTIEGWFRFTSFSTTDSHGLISSMNNSTGAGLAGWALGYSNVGAGGLYLIYYRAGFPNSSTTRITTTGRLNTNQWYHIAITSDGINVRAFIDGVLANTTNYAAYPNFSYRLTLGAWDYFEGRKRMNGYISNVRILNFCLYKNSFTRPTKPFNPVYNNMVFLYQAPSYQNRKYTKSTIYGLTIKGRNYNETIINNLVTDLDGEILTLDNCKFEDFSLQNSINNLNSTTINIKTNSDLIEGSFNFHNNIFNISPLTATVINNYQSDIYTETGFSFMNHYNISENHFRLLKAGKISYDKIVVNSPNTVSERLEPYSSTIKLRSVKLIPINKGENYSISVTLKKSPDYTGAAPRLMLKHNGSLGYNSDYVLATSVLGNNVWETITGSLPSASLDNGMVEVYVDCSGNLGSGYINIDSWKLI